MEISFIPSLSSHTQLTLRFLISSGTHVELRIWIAGKVPYRKSRRRRSIPSYVLHFSIPLPLPLQAACKMRTGHRVEESTRPKGYWRRATTTRAGLRALHWLAERSKRNKLHRPAPAAAGRLTCRTSRTRLKFARVQGSSRCNVGRSCGNHVNRPFHAEFSRVMYSLSKLVLHFRFLVSPRPSSSLAARFLSFSLTVSLQSPVASIALSSSLLVILLSVSQQGEFATAGMMTTRSFAFARCKCGVKACFCLHRRQEPRTRARLSWVYT